MLNEPMILHRLICVGYIDTEIAKIEETVKKSYYLLI